MQPRAVSCAVALVLSFACAAVHGAGADPLPIVFASIGNWGDGSTEQKSVADALNAKTDIKFVVSVGDNFVPTGVNNATDPLFASNFENLYTRTVPWQIVLGDADWRGSAPAQQAYATAEPAPKRWGFPVGAAAGAVPAPAYFYSKVETIDATANALFVYVDTTSLVSGAAAEVDKMYAWMEATLTASDAEWKFVVGHHSVLSVGEYPVPDTFSTRFANLLISFPVDAYFCGHSHTFQHITHAYVPDPNSRTVTPVPAGPCETFNSGGGGSTVGTIVMNAASAAAWAPTAATASSPLKFAALNRGFALHALSATTLTTKFIDASAGAELYSFVQYPRGAFAPVPPSGVTRGEIAIVVMCTIFVLGAAIAILAFSYRQHRMDEAAKAARAQNGGSSSAPGLIGEGKFEAMSVVSSATAADSKSEL